MVFSSLHDPFIVLFIYCCYRALDYVSGYQLGFFISTVTAYIISCHIIISYSRPQMAEPSQITVTLPLEPPATYAYPATAHASDSSKQSTTVCDTSVSIVLYCTRSSATAEKQRVCIRAQLTHCFSAAAV